ncbi:hypothetical protein PATSB16_22390 [Pandoraea thiooxydans]|nr:hypothetical protein PATSB16_22390 [Pandoraea thiooxydans]
MANTCGFQGKKGVFRRICAPNPYTVPGLPSGQASFNMHKIYIF